MACTTWSPNAGWVSVGITTDTPEFAVALDPALVHEMARAISASERADDHRRLRRLE